MKDKHITHLIGNSLRDVINEARSRQVGSEQNNEIHFKRLIYKKERNLVVVEIGHEQLIGVPKSLFEGNVIKQALIEHLDCARVDIMDLGKNTYIYIWATPNEQFEIANMAYVI